MSKEQEKALADIDAEFTRRGIAPPRDDLSAVDAELARRKAKSPNAGVAGILKFATSVAGAPVDAVENALNLGIAGANAAYRSLPSYPLVQQGQPAELLRGSVGGSESLQKGLRATGVSALNPDNPNPQDRTGTLAYDLAARGAAVPGGVAPAVGSVIAEHVLGPEYAGVGAMAPAAAMQGVRAAAGTTLSPEAKLLRSEGVQLTPGQERGGVVKRLEDAATSIPVFGDMVKGAQRRGMEQYTRAAINRALRPIGEKLPDNLTGNKAVEYAYGKLGEKYDELLPNLKGDLNYKAPANALPATVGQQAPASLREELDSLRSMGQNLPEPQRGQLNRIIDKEVIDRFTPQGLASGETLKDIESKLGGLKTTFRKSENYDVRNLGDAVDAMQGSLRRMVNRVNPEYEGELAKINEGYANFKIGQRAAGTVGAQEGTFTPAQLHGAVRASDKSKDKARFAEGNALMQDLSVAGKKVLPSTVPDSGTPLRAALMYSLANPIKAGALAIPVGAASMAYTPLGMRAISKLGEPGTANLEQIIAQAIVAEQQANGHGFPTLEQSKK
jgi:hypothetical protein